MTRGPAVLVSAFPTSARMRSACAATAALLLAGCASTGPKVLVDKADTFDAARCQSFGWHAQSSQPASFTDQRVRGHVLSTLKEKGYPEVSENPSCRVTYVLSTREIPKSRPGVGVGVGGGSGGIGGGIGVTLPVGRRATEAGTFTIDIIDASQNAQIWSGSVDAEFGSAELTDEEAKRVVEKVLAEYPNKP